MKLPGIKYKQRGPLARIDPSSYLAEGQANASAFRAVGEAAGNIYEKESVAQMEQALSTYTDQMDVWSDKQEPYVNKEDSEDKEGAWLKGPQRYEKYEGELRETLSRTQLTTPLARRLFAQRANERNLQNKMSYRDKLQAWQSENQLSMTLTVAGRYASKKDFDGARETVANSVTVGTLSETKGLALIQKYDYDEMYFTVSSGVEKVDTAKDALRYRQTVGGSALKESDKKKVLAGLDDKFINARIIDVQEVIQVAEEQNGSAQEGYDAGVAYLSKLIRQRPDELGGDAQFQSELITVTKTVLDRYKPRVKAFEQEALREQNTEDWLMDRAIASPTYNALAFNDHFAVNILNYKRTGASGYDKNLNDPNEVTRGITTPDFLTNKTGARSEFVNASVNEGWMPELGEDILNAALTGNNGEWGAGAAQAVYEIAQDNPRVLWRRGENNDLIKVATTMELLGGGEEAAAEAYRLWKQSSVLSRDQRKAILGPSGERNNYFDENFDAYFEKQYQRDTPFYDFLTSTTPSAQRQFSNYKNTARKLMDDYIIINDGNLGRGLSAAIIALKGSYSASSVNGTYQIMQDAPESIVPDGEIDGGTWIREQLLGDVKGLLGDDYDTQFVTVEPVFNFDRSDPVYQVYDDNPDYGFRRAITLERFSYKETSQYKEVQAADEALAAANKRLANNAKLRAQWDIDNPPISRGRKTRRGNRSKRNPHGDVPGSGSLPRAAQRAYKGSEQIGKTLFDITKAQKNIWSGLGNLLRGDDTPRQSGKTKRRKR